MALAVELGVTDVEDLVSNSWGVVLVRRGHELLFLCPNPKHNESHPSCSINDITGLWHCFSCGAGGDVVRLGVLVTGRSTEEVEAELSDTSDTAQLERLERKLKNLRMQVSRLDVEPVLPPVPTYDDTSHMEELYDRGFTPATIAAAGIRWVDHQALDSRSRPGHQFTIRDSIGIPISSADGRLAGWCYRRTMGSPEWQPRYLYSPHLEPSHIWYGGFLPGSAPVVVVEGALDGLWINQCGYSTRGALGSSMVGRKIRALTECDSVVLFGDRDAAGVRLVSQLARAIAPVTPTRVVLYRRGEPYKDPQECPPDVVKRMVDGAIPAQEWLRRVSRRD